MTNEHRMTNTHRAKTPTNRNQMYMTDGHPLVNNNQSCTSAERDYSHAYNDFRNLTKLISVANNLWIRGEINCCTIFS